MPSTWGEKEQTPLETRLRLDGKPQVQLTHSSRRTKGRKSLPAESPGTSLASSESRTNSQPDNLQLGASTPTGLSPFFEEQKLEVWKLQARVTVLPSGKGQLPEPNQVRGENYFLNHPGLNDFLGWGGKRDS